MAASGDKTLPTIGFLTVVEHAETGLTGGLLILNTAGRPVEFHCTAPLKPNRAQEILYGHTLRPYLYGEQIGQTLLSKARNETLFVCTDVEPALCVRDSVDLPVVLVLDGRETGQSAQGACRQRMLRFDQSHAVLYPNFTQLIQFQLGKQSVAVPAQRQTDRDIVVQRWQPYQEHLDLSEPFGRIREALEEAQRGAAK